MAASDGVSIDRLLGGRVTIQQPAAGYRAAVDPVLLAASVPAAAGETVLDLGCGTGAAALCLAARVDGVAVEGVDIQNDLVRLARENAGLSGLAGRVRFQRADVLALSLGKVFDHVMANPPYLARGTGTAPPDPAKAAANMEGDAVLADWIAAAVAAVADGGSVTFVHRYDRRDEVAAEMARGCGDIVGFPLWADPARTRAKRIIVQARKRAATPDGARRAAESDGLILHNADGSFTAEAEAVLRDAAPLHI